jgi:hypothetical protein
MELVGVERECRAVPDARRVGGYSARYVEQASLLRRPAPGQQLGEQVSVPADGRVDPGVGRGQLAGRGVAHGLQQDPATRISRIRLAVGAAGDDVGEPTAPRPLVFR